MVAKRLKIAGCQYGRQPYSYTVTNQFKCFGWRESTHELLWCQNKLEIQDCADRESNLEASEPVSGVTMALPMAETRSS